MTKGTKIEGIAVVRRTGSAIIGTMPWETYFVDFDFAGNVYRWHSANSEQPGLSVGQQVNIRAFVRPDSNRLYRVMVATDGN